MNYTAFSPLMDFAGTKGAEELAMDEFTDGLDADGSSEGGETGEGHGKRRRRWVRLNVTRVMGRRKGHQMTLSRCLMGPSACTRGGNGSTILIGR